MPKLLSDPIFFAEYALLTATSAGRSASDMVYLRAMYKEAGHQLSDCQIATATYLSWHESLLKSGVRFEEHVGKLGVPACSLDAGIESLHREQKGREDEARRESFYQEHLERERRKRIAVGGGAAAAVVAAVGWVYMRRRARERISSSESRPSN